MLERVGWPVPLWGPCLGLVVIGFGFNPQLAGIIAIPAVLPLMVFGSALSGGLSAEVLILAYPILPVLFAAVTIWLAVTTEAPDDKKWLLNVGLFFSLALIGAYGSLLTVDDGWRTTMQHH
jgi:hypothetical protein